MAGEGEIKVYGAIRSMTGEGKVAFASQLYDEELGKSQGDINREVSGGKSNVHVGEFNAGNITEEGWYDQVTSGRPAGSDNDEYYLLYMSTSKSQICFSKKNSSKIYYRASQQGEWQKVSYSVHHGEFNANSVNEEGWYDSITLGRPEGSESDEKYFMYMSSNGGQVCFSRRNSGKAYHRLGLEHPWVAITHDDFSAELPLSAITKTLNLVESIEELLGATNMSYDSSTRLWESYAGDTLSVLSFFASVRVALKPNDIVRVRCAYRKGSSRQGIENYPYDSDAYVFIGTENGRNHDLAHLRSNIVKVKSLGSQNFPFTEGEQGWQDLAFMRDRFFKNDWEYGWHYLKYTGNAEDTPYVNIYGDFSVASSWFVIDKVEVYRATEAFPSDPQLGITDANQLVQSGFTGYVVTNIPEAATGWGSLSVRRATSADGNGFTPVEQIFYSRAEADLGKIWMRIGFIDSNGQFNPMSWCQIAG